MIKCVPKWFSNTYTLSGEGSVGAVRFNWMSEQGLVDADGREFQVQKHGVFSGRWTLSAGGEEIADAKKESAFRRTFGIHTPEGNLKLRARSMFGRTMVLSGSGVDAVIRPNHIFSRSFSIAGTLPPFEICGFVFWLTIMLQRRQNNSE